MKTTVENIHSQFETLKLAFMREHYAEIIGQAAQHQWSPEEILARLLDGEIQQRADRALQNHIKNARFPFIKTIDDFDWSWPKKINRAQIQHIFHLDWLPLNGNIFFLGGVGLGKSHLALAMSYHACQKGYTVRWVTAINLINTLLAAQRTHRLKTEIKAFLKPQLLTIDELGYMPIDKAGADLLFQIISERYERGAICITSNKPFKQWATIFNNDTTLTSAILDRILHHGEPVIIEGKSYRMKDRIETE
jgi:DNA replication protein DnaC